MGKNNYRFENTYIYYIPESIRKKATNQDLVKEIRTKKYYDGSIIQKRKYHERIARIRGR